MTGIALGALVYGRAPGTAAADEQRDACGCYADSAGNCYCDLGAKCGCPGLCEPRGCADERQRQLEKEIDAETRRAQQAERAAEDVTREDAAPSPAAAPAAKSPPPRPPSHARKLSSRQQRDLARLLELYVAQDPERHAMSTDDVLKNLGQQSPIVKRP